MNIFARAAEIDTTVSRVQEAAAAGRWPEALELLDSLADAGDEYRRLLLLRARVLYRSQDYEAAEAAFSSLLELEPNSTEALISLARIAFGRQKWEIARDYADRVVALEPDWLPGRQLAARIALRMDDRGRALEEYSAVRRLDPQDREALSSLGNLHMAAAHTEEAREALRALVRHHPATIGQRLMLAKAELAAREDDRALPVLRSIVQESDNREAQLLLGRLLSRKRLDTEALSLWRQVAAVSDAASEPDLQIARILLRNPGSGDPVPHLRRVLGADPHHAEALQQTSKYLAGRGEWRLLAEILGPLNPAEPAAAAALARAYYQLRREAQAAASRELHGEVPAE